MNLNSKQNKYYGDGCQYVPCDNCFHKPYCKTLINFPKTKGCLFRCGDMGIWTCFPMNGGEE